MTETQAAPALKEIFDRARLGHFARETAAIAPGFDADIVLWDANRQETITQAGMHYATDYTPYEGMRVTGWPVMTLLAGKVVCEEGRILGEPGDGRFLPRDLSPYASPPTV